MLQPVEKQREVGNAQLINRENVIMKMCSILLYKQ